MRPLFDSDGLKKKGVALVLTLAILVIATILVVGFATSMRTERQASASIAQSLNAGLIVQSAIDHAISILDRHIPQPIPPGGSTLDPTNWIISPGLLTTVQGPDSITQIPLSSGNAAPAPAVNAELNVPLISGAGYTILPTSDSIRVAWVPMMKDPSLAASLTNQITGQYAFWIDDESAKINLNTAQGKPVALDFTKVTPGTISVPNPTPNPASIYPLGHPSSVNLDVLGGTIDLTSLETAIRTQNGLASREAIKAHVPAGSADAFFNSNKFSLTTYSRAPEFNVFGKSRLYFLRSPTSVLGNPLFQFFRDAEGPNYFPAEENARGADRQSTYYTAAAISAYLNRNDWPGMPARSFVQKWGGAAPGTPLAGKTAAQKAADREADQVAWNLLSLGSFASGAFSGTTASGNYYELANATTSGELGFVSANKPNRDSVIGALSGKAMMPHFPVPLINEVSLVISPEYYTIADGTAKYRLKVSLNVELWLPSNYPAYDFTQSQMTVGMTYLYYRATQGSPPTADVSQEDTKYVDRSASPNDNGIRKLWISNNVGTMNPGEYSQLTTILPFYMKNVSGFNPASSGAEDFLTSGTISITFKMRLFALFQQSTGGGTYGSKFTSQLIPVWDKRDLGTAAPTNWNPPPPPTPLVALDAPADDPNDYIEFTFDLDPSQFGTAPEPYTRSLEVADPRSGGLSRVWQQAPNFNDQATLNADTMSSINSATTTAAYDTKKLAFVDIQSAFSTNSVATGFLSILPTGMQRGLAGATLKFQPSASDAELPDWLLLDLVAPQAIASNYLTASYVNTTAGAINVNGKLTPAFGTFSRWQPLQALLKNMPGAPDTSPASGLVTNILNHSLAGTDFGAPGVYDYPGEICEIAGVADSGASDWDREIIIRNLAGIMTTKSNVFSVWGVAQTIKKRSTNTGYGVFENGDIVTGEKRFEAVIERYVWPGKEGAVGNGNVSAGGTYNSLSSSQSWPGLAPPYPTTAAAPTWETLDGPNAPTYPPAGVSLDPWVQNARAHSPTTLEAANNPVGAVMKYRVISFRYLTE